jgi:4-amino-4-deoxy-L-arabinose transferase-like glycosyltransferase
MSFFGRHAWPLTMLAVGVVSALVLQQVVFRGDAITTDENSYLFQARVLSTGRLWAPAPRERDIVQFPASMINLTPTRWFSRYPVGHPLALVPGVLTGYPLLTPLVCLAGTLWLTFLIARRWYDEPTARTTVVLMALSPYFISMHATLLSHSTALLCFAVFLYGGTRMLESAGSRWAVVTGLSLGYLFNTRPFTAVLVSWPFLTWGGWRLLNERSPRALRQVTAAAVAGLIGIGGYLAYNNATTGSWRLSPYTLYNPDERPGFVEIQGREHTPERGVRRVTNNLRRLNHWWLGFNASFVVLLGLVVMRWRRHDWMLLATLLSLVGGYFFFYYGGVDTVGPVYYYEGVIAMSMLAARSILSAWGFVAPRLGIARLWKPVAVLALSGWAVSLGFFYRERAESWEDVFETQRRLHDAVTAAAPSRALVLMEVPAQTWYGVRYDPREPLNVIFVRSRDDREAEILAAYPDRQIYRYQGRQLERIR